MNPIVMCPSTAGELGQTIDSLREAQRRLATVAFDSVVGLFDRVAAAWQPGSTYYREALTMLAGTFSSRAVEAALQGLVMGMTPAFLQAGLERELGRADLLERWQPDALGVGHVKGYPLGVVAHVLAGNVFLGGVIAMGQSLLTRNATLLKLSRDDSGFTALFAQSLIEADHERFVAPALAVASWDSQSDAFNEVLRQQADAVVVWGGAAAIAGYPADRCRGRVIHYGPRLGVALVLDGADLAGQLPSLAWDVALWEQQACSSPRVVFVEDIDGSGNGPREVGRRLHAELRQIRTEIPPRPMSLDDKAEVRSIRDLAWWTQSAEVVADDGAFDHTVLLTTAPPSDVPIGHRTVLIVPVRSVAGVPSILAPYRAGLQTAVMAAPSTRWHAAVDALVEAGLTEVVAPGAAAARFLGLPHEGEFALRRLVKLVAVDLGFGPLTDPRRSPDAIREIAGRLAAPVN